MEVLTSLVTRIDLVTTQWYSAKNLIDVPLIMIARRTDMNHCKPLNESRSNVYPGSGRIEFVKTFNGRHEVAAIAQDVTNLRGLIKINIEVSADEMNNAIMAKVMQEQSNVFSPIHPTSCQTE